MSAITFNKLLNKNIPRKFICESGPPNLTHDGCSKYVSELLHLPMQIAYPIAMTAIYGFGYQLNPYYYEANETLIYSPSLFINSNNDKYLNREFIDTFRKQFGTKINYLPNGSHHNVAKANAVEYQEILNNFIK